jgi:hypothetical protein
MGEGFAEDCFGVSKYNVTSYSEAETLEATSILSGLIAASALLFVDDIF